jgi:hypothetical protein
MSDKYRPSVQIGVSQMVRELDRCKIVPEDDLFVSLDRHGDCYQSREPEPLEWQPQAHSCSHDP